MNDNNIQMHAIIRGRVQGVGFRATASDYAQSLGLSGTVCNCADGSVEIYVQGAREHADRLLELLKGSHRIESLEIDYSQPTHIFVGFRIVAR